MAKKRPHSFQASPGLEGLSVCLIQPSDVPVHNLPEQRFLAFEGEIEAGSSNAKRTRKLS